MAKNDKKQLGLHLCFNRSANNFVGVSCASYSGQDDVMNRKTSTFGADEVSTAMAPSSWLEQGEAASHQTCLTLCLWTVLAMFYPYFGSTPRAPPTYVAFLFQNVSRRLECPNTTLKSSSDSESSHQQWIPDPQNEMSSWW